MITRRTDCLHICKSLRSTKYVLISMNFRINVVEYVLHVTVYSPILIPGTVWQSLNVHRTERCTFI